MIDEDQSIEVFREKVLWYMYKHSKSCTYNRYTIKPYIDNGQLIKIRIFQTFKKRASLLHFCSCFHFDKKYTILYIAGQITEPAIQLRTTWCARALFTPVGSQAAQAPLWNWVRMGSIEDFEKKILNAKVQSVFITTHDDCLCVSLLVSLLRKSFFGIFLHFLIFWSLL
jgi:hypothetical protein